MRDYAVLADGPVRSYQQTYHLGGRCYGLILMKRVLWYEEGKVEISGVTGSPGVYIRYSIRCGEDVRGKVLELRELHVERTFLGVAWHLRPFGVRTVYLVNPSRNTDSYNSCSSRTCHPFRTSLA